MADTITILRSELRRSLHGPAWHGPALLENLADVSAVEAVARPIAGGHSIAEIAVHALAWLEEVTRRLHTDDARMPERGDWTTIDTLDDKGWTDIKAALTNAGAALDAALAAFPPERLGVKVGGDAASAPLGSGVPYGVMLHGLAQHNAYHGGQVAVVRRAARAAR
ncbi:MAG: DinB family protein [Acidobacteriota bacterium]